MAARTKAKQEESSRLKRRYSRNLSPAGREEVTRVWQTALDWQDMGGSSVSDTLADFKCQIERGSWGPACGYPGLKPSGAALRGRDFQGKNDEWHLAKVCVSASQGDQTQFEATLRRNQKGKEGLLGCFQQECILGEDQVLISRQKPEKRNQSPAEKVP